MHALKLLNNVQSEPKLNSIVWLDNYCLCLRDNYRIIYTVLMLAFFSFFVFGVKSVKCVIFYYCLFYMSPRGGVGGEKRVLGACAKARSPPSQSASYPIYIYMYPINTRLIIINNTNCNFLIKLWLDSLNLFWIKTLIKNDIINETV